MFGVVFSERANETFESIQLQLLERWGETIVIKFEERTLSVLENISKSPFIYQAIETDPNVRKAVIQKNCSLFYRIHQNKIIVLFFWDNRQDPVLL